jgi:hypothetical protein
MSEEITKARSVGIDDDVTLYFISEMIDGEACDTQVMLGDEDLFWIEGAQIENFVAEFRALVEKYRI